MMQLVHHLFLMFCFLLLHVILVELPMKVMINMRSKKGYKLLSFGQDQS